MQRISNHAENPTFELMHSVSWSLIHQITEFALDLYMPVYAFNQFSTINQATSEQSEKQLDKVGNTWRGRHLTKALYLYPSAREAKTGQLQTGTSATSEDKMTCKSQRWKQLPRRVTERRAATNRPGKGR